MIASASVTALLSAKRLLLRTAHRPAQGRRASRCILLSVALVVVAACQPLTTGCFEVEFGDCPSTRGEAADTARVVGFPLARVDSAAQGQLHVGESVTLYFVLLGRGVFGQDTSRTATWSIDNLQTAVRIGAVGNGAARLTAVAPGSVGGVLVNGQAFTLWACDLVCTHLTRIVVSP